jgi:hypothetical protein
VFLDGMNVVSHTPIFAKIGTDEDLNLVALHSRDPTTVDKLMARMAQMSVGFCHPTLRTSNPDLQRSR